jgi:hypothetical protein
MGGWYLDVYIAYFFKWIARIVHRLGSDAWPIIRASVTSSSSSPGGFGCSTAEVIYIYEIESHIFGGRNEKPFISPVSAENYAAMFPRGSSMIVRTKPQTPEVSVVLDRDQFGRKAADPPTPSK